MGPFDPIPGQEPFGARFGQFGACQLAIEICFWKPWEYTLFRPNPCQEPFGARFWQFEACQLAIEICFWKAWEWTLWGPNPGQKPFGASFANLGLASWLLEFASGNLGNMPSLSQILARSLLEPDLGNLEPWEPSEA